MDPSAQIETVTATFEQLGVPVREEHLGGGGGGFCTVRGQRVVFVDLDADPATRLERSLAALAGLTEVDAIYLPPALREQITSIRAGER